MSPCSLKLVVTAFSLAGLVPLASAAAMPDSWSSMLLQPTNLSPTNVSPPIGVKKIYASKLCSHQDKTIEQDAWNDALKFARALASWEANSSFQSAMDLYMGNHSRGPLGVTLRENIIGAVNVHNDSMWADNQRMFVLCHEPLGFLIGGDFAGYCDIGGIAYAMNDRGRFFNNHYITLCPLFYMFPSLTSRLDKIARGKRKCEIDNEWCYASTQGDVLFHESLHWDNLTTPPHHHIGDDPTGYGSLYDGVYGPREVINVAKTRNTEATVNISDAYASAAAAILAQQIFNLSDPPRPKAEPADGSESLIPFLRVGRSYEEDEEVPKRFRPYFPDPDTPNNLIAIDALGLSLT